MDPGDFIYLALFALWLYSQIAAAAKKNKQRQEELAARQRAAKKPPPAAPLPRVPPPEPVTKPEPTGVGETLLLSLSDLEQEIQAALGEVDERVRAQVAFLVEHELRAKADALRRELRDETSPEFTRASRETEWLLSHYRGLLQTARVHSGLRGQRELRRANVIADRLGDELNQPRKVENPLPPPVAIVWDVAATDRLRQSALADATLFVPRTVTQDPSHWSLLAPEIARYLGASAPTLYQDIDDGLELGASEAHVGSDPEALTRVLFASWIGRIVSDAMGASFYGPAYLRSIAGLYAQPGSPARVTSIVLNQDGTVHAEPPAHARVHITARWVTRMGYASEAAAIRRRWDEEHGSPEVLGFWGSMTSLPAAPVLDAAATLTDELYQLPLDAFGKVRLAHVPGIAGWESYARQAAAAKPMLLAGERAAGPPRALVAAAIETAIESPEANPRIHAALYDSLSTPVPVAAPSKAMPARRAAPLAARGPFPPLTGRDVAEALIVGDLLLEPPSLKLRRARAAFARGD